MYMKKINNYIFFLFSNVIDVSAIDAHTMEQHEYYDRMRQYKLVFLLTLLMVLSNQHLDMTDQGIIHNMKLTFMKFFWCDTLWFLNRTFD